MSATDYNFTDIEKKWQAYWAEHKTFKTYDFVEGKKKCYVLDMFPYPSGAGLHVGHPEGYTATDIFCRYKRQQGFNVLHPMGWDAFGLPAEQYAIETGTHPEITTAKNIATFKRQIQSLGFSYDWDREVNTTDPSYFKWTQWIFKKLYEKGLAYVAEVPVNWCPALGTVLANEEVINGRSERGNHPVERRPMRQWMLKITAYAERLLADIETVDWPEGIKEMQRNWIGKSTGAEVSFGVKFASDVAASGDSIVVYTTRCDTLFGATYMVMSPEHTLVKKWLGEGRIANADAVRAYQVEASHKSDFERTEVNKDKTGVCLEGVRGVNPVNGKDIPIFISDYVLATYGTGAIMAVPAHDERDFDFAKVFGLPIVQVVAPADSEAAASASPDPVPYEGEAAFTDIAAGVMVSSGFLTGLTVADAKAKMIAWLEEKGIGRAKVQYKLRDWLFSRQRYWGEPFPVVHMDDGSTLLVDDGDLPLTLPVLEDYKPAGDGNPPLSKAKAWLRYSDPKTGKQGWRETNTMPQWAGSCWYYLRYIDPHNDKAFADPEKLRYWLPVDLYVGGAEHAVLHLLYARFWHKVLFDLGLVPTNEPFQKLINQGMILGVSYKDGRGALVPTDKVDLSGAKPVHKETGEELVEFAAKMSKSLKNVVNPDDVIRDYGADSVRLYEMFMGPLNAVKPWNTKGLEGVHRFLKRAWRMVADQPIADRELTRDELRVVHSSIKKVTEDIESILGMNTAISQLMIFVNAFSGEGKEIPRAAAEAFTILLSPFAPHLCEELWERLGHTESIAYQPWPTYEEKFLTVAEVEILVQVLGKPKARITVPADADAKALEAIALANDAVKAAIAGKTVRKVVAVPGRLVNIVAN